MDNKDIIQTHDITLSHGGIKLRSMSDRDFNILQKWNNDADVLYFAESGDVECHSLEDIEYIYGYVSSMAFCFIIEYDGHAIGECWLQQMNLPHILEQYPNLDLRRMDIMIGEKEYWGKGIGTKVVQMLTQFGFESESADMIFYMPESHNIRSCKVAERLGYKLVSKTENEGNSKSKFTFNYAMTKGDYRGNNQGVTDMNYLTDKAQKLTPYVAGIQPQEPGWIKLNTNENPYPPSPKVAAFLASADISKLRLYPDMDSTILRQAIASRYNVGPENVFCGNGSDEVLALAYQAFFSGKENILTPDISYGFYPVWGKMYDVNKTYIPLEEDFSINPSRYKNGNGVILANPNAPTGNALSLCEVEQIVQNNPAGVVIIDEAYIDFAGVESAVPFTHKYKNLLVVQTFSKAYSLAGLRVGFAVGSKALMDGLQLMKDAFNPYPLGWLEQQIATIAFTDAGYWDKTRKKIVQMRDKTIAELRNMGFAVQDSHTNFIFMKAQDDERAKGLYEHLLANKILVRYWQKPRISGFLRVSVGTDAEMEAFLQCVKQF